MWGDFLLLCYSTAFLLCAIAVLVAALPTWSVVILYEVHTYESAVFTASANIQI